jgi:hypothetical protein
MRCRDYELLEHPRRVSLAAESRATGPEPRRADYGAL